jgi:TIGR03009 family protein
MKRSLGRNWKWAAWSFAWLVLGGGALAQGPDQQWQAAPNNQPNYPNYQPAPQGGAYQPSTAPGPSAPGNPAAGQPAGQYQYQQQPDQPVGPPPYPGIERRQPAAPGYGNPPDNRAVNSPQDPRAQAGGFVYDQAAGRWVATPLQDPRMPGGANQGPPLVGPPAARQPLQGPPARPPAPQAPFVLSPQEAAVLERLLADWEKRNKEIHLLESKFYRWKYDLTFGNGQPPKPDEGELKFAAPDKGMMKIEAKDPVLSEQWLCDGKAIYQFNYKERLVTEFVLPLEMQGKGIGDGPLPFVFGVEAEKLKQRYFMRIITPGDVKNAVWLEAFPRYPLAEFSKVQVILQISGPTNALLPFAIQIFSPNGKDRTVYQLEKPEVNPSGGPLGIGELFKPDWKIVSIPSGWKKKIELPPPPVEAGLIPSMQPRR